MKEATTFAVEVLNLTYKFPDCEKPSLVEIDLKIPWNTRTLVVGSNGAGKSTLLKLLSGKHLCLNGKILVNGSDPFSPVHSSNDGQEEYLMTTYLGTEWCHMSIINRDIGVAELLQSIGLAHFQKRGDTLCNILGVDLDWRMFKLSDGQKRRVQLVMGLLKPWRVLLLDEVTVDLDVIARSKLLNFLKWETETRKCSIVYATHIFDGLSEWPDQILHLKEGHIVESLNYHQDVKFVDATNEASGNGAVTYHRTSDPASANTSSPSVLISKVKSLHPLAQEWLRDDPNDLSHLLINDIDQPLL